MKLSILSVGKPKASVIADGVRDYVQRVQRYASLELVTVASEDIAPRTRAGDVAVALGKEAARLLDKIPAGACVVALDREGRALSSSELATELGRWQQSERAVVFVIGSAFGLDPKVLERARLRLSLSRLTLPHELALLVLAEQVYRAHTILRSEPYHK